MTERFSLYQPENLKLNYEEKSPEKVKIEKMSKYIIWPTATAQKHCTGFNRPLSENSRDETTGETSDISTGTKRAI